MTNAIAIPIPTMAAFFKSMFHLDLFQDIFKEISNHNNINHKITHVDEMVFSSFTIVAFR